MDITAYTVLHTGLLTFMDLQITLTRQVKLCFTKSTVRTSLQGWGQVQLTKYSSIPSTRNIYQVQVLVKYSFFKKKYLSTSSTFILSTSTSTITHIKILHWSLISILIMVYLCSVDKRKGLLPDYFVF